MLVTAAVLRWEMSNQDFPEEEPTFFREEPPACSGLLGKRSAHQRRCSGPAANFVYAADALPLKTSVTVSALKVLQRR